VLVAGAAGLAAADKPTTSVSAPEGGEQATKFLSEVGLSQTKKRRTEKPPPAVVFSWQRSPVYFALTGISKANLETRTCGGISMGYLPSKHARQNLSLWIPMARATPPRLR